MGEGEGLWTIKCNEVVYGLLLSLYSEFLLGAIDKHYPILMVALLNVFVVCNLYGFMDGKVYFTSKEPLYPFGICMHIRYIKSDFM